MQTMQASRTNFYYKRAALFMAMNGTQKVEVAGAEALVLALIDALRD